LKLVHVVLRFFQTFARQDTFALFMDLKHMEFRLFFGPAKDRLKDMGYVIHEVNGIIPANDQVSGFQPGFWLLLCLENSAWKQLWDGCICHKRKVKEDLAVVEQGVGVQRGTGSDRLKTLPFGVRGGKIKLRLPAFGEIVAKR